MKRENLPRAIVLESEIKNLEGLEMQLDNPTLRIGVYNPLSKFPVMEFQNNTDAESNEILGHAAAQTFIDNLGIVIRARINQLREEMESL